MIESYNEQVQRINKQLNEVHKQYTFENTDIYKSLCDELEQSFKDNDTILAMEIIGDIEQAKINLKAKLPWWYKARWQIGNSQEVEQEARKLYKQNIYNRR